MSSLEDVGICRKLLEPESAYLGQKDRWKLPQALAGRHGRCVCLGERASREDRVAHAHACEKAWELSGDRGFSVRHPNQGIVRHTRDVGS